MPFRLWDGERPLVATRKDLSNQVRGDWVGYCAHATYTFPGWHRPYLVMIEQSLYEQMTEIAETFQKEEHKKLYRNAVKKFRLPYWDYYKPRGGQVEFTGLNGGSTTFPFDYRLPDIFTRENVMLRTAETQNELKSFPNPLKSFKFPPKEKGANIWMQKAIDADGNPTNTQVMAMPPVATVRDLNNKLNQVREQDNEYCNNIILFPGYDNFLNVVTARLERGGTAGSIEGLHNGYHNYLGNGGQMSDPAVAAFDPVFWIHHCQIDRIYAIWQASHPNEWDSGVGKEFLYPFRYPQPTSKHKYWTVDDARYTSTSLGYTYVDAEFPTAQAVRDNYKAKYDWAVRYRGRRAQGHDIKNLGTCPKSMLPPTAEQYAKAQVFASAGPVGRVQQVVQKAAVNTIQSTQLMAESTINAAQIIVGNAREPKPQASNKSAAVEKSTPSSKLTDSRVLSGELYENVGTPKDGEVNEAHVQRRWYIDNMVERLALNGTFTISYFIGPFDDNKPDSWNLTPTLAGQSHNFAAPVEQCDNCGHQEQQGLLVTDTTPVTPLLLDYVLKGELHDLRPESVEPFLVKNLRWRIVKLGGERIDPRVVPGLKIGISTLITPVEGAAEPTRVQEFPQIVEQIIGNAS
ncbi:Tyrosinase [Cyphellophora attinorum]|uniref:tyrosinase n=1 Tax=Cyphellophora attinorum TaxID=1664694 RepID=A0A0N0NN05_9EURO|nr:Tyrosinase [Phialophora attinorum]KPI40958.1 Tyrosinase [Phialophora attinorum]